MQMAGRCGNYEFFAGMKIGVPCGYNGQERGAPRHGPGPEAPGDAEAVCAGRDRDVPRSESAVDWESDGPQARFGLSACQAKTLQRAC